MTRLELFYKLLALTKFAEKERKTSPEKQILQKGDFWDRKKFFCIRPN